MELGLGHLLLVSRLTPVRVSIKVFENLEVEFKVFAVSDHLDVISGSLLSLLKGNVSLSEDRLYLCNVNTLVWATDFLEEPKELDLLLYGFITGIEDSKLLLINDILTKHLKHTLRVKLDPIEISLLGLKNI